MGSGNQGRGFRRDKGRGNKNSGRGSDEKNNKNNKNNEEMKFAPQTGGKTSKVTFDVVKEHIVVSIKKTCDRGVDVVRCSETGVDGHVPAQPT